MPSFEGAAERGADPGGREVRRRQRRQVAAAQTARSRAWLLEVHDDVRHGHVEAHPRGLDDALLEPVRAARRVGRDHDLVGGELAERVLERLQRIAVPDLAARVTPTAASRARLASSRACAAARAPSSSDVHVRSLELSAGQTRSTSSSTPSAFRPRRSGAPRRRRSRSRRRGCDAGAGPARRGPAQAAGACRRGSPRARPPPAGGRRRPRARSRSTPRPRRAPRRRGSARPPGRPRPRREPGSSCVRPAEPL